MKCVSEMVYYCLTWLTLFSSKFKLPCINFLPQYVANIHHVMIPAKTFTTWQYFVEVACLIMVMNTSFVVSINKI